MHVNYEEFSQDSIWYHTKLPSVIVDEIEKEVSDVSLQDAKVFGDANSLVDNKLRSSQVSFIPGTSWVSAFCYYYVKRANAMNFKYDITDFYSGDCLQYTVYNEGQFYNWHVDSLGFEHGLVRKLSFSLQLSDENDYEGGDLQLLNTVGNSSYFIPKERGTIIIFDSHIKHRVKKIRSGTRKSIVGWVLGPKLR